MRPPAWQVYLAQKRDAQEALEGAASPLPGERSRRREGAAAGSASGQAAEEPAAGQEPLTPAPPSGRRLGLSLRLDAAGGDASDLAGVPEPQNSVTPCRARSRQLQEDDAEEAEGEAGPRGQLEGGLSGRSQRPRWLPHACSDELGGQRADSGAGTQAGSGCAVRDGPRVRQALQEHEAEIAKW